ncbi:MAG: aspartate 1-decarboxylase [Phormidium sp. BM_Day4_Bin.17]|nr:aspartate 1-decarboxylase [Sodalinema gerasimenkoae]MCC5898795.1 aspartate 1-decarboxylase [Phormidium sp. BM_Day4_Bin.17]UCJ14510.1 MAG: aspartate 1-decarboxylase [Phormidium sp. PBR-2020]
MQRSLLYAKLHNCTLTGSNLDYMGSISIDRALLDEVGIVPYEQVQIVNVNNGERLMSYVICAPPQSGLIELNGAAARLGMKGDRLIIMAYAQFSAEDLKEHQPKVVILGQGNRIEAVHHYPHPLAPIEQQTAEAQLV